MTVGSIVEHWAHGRGIVIAVETRRYGVQGIKVHWNEPVEWVSHDPEDPSEPELVNSYWTDPDDLIVISEAK